MNLNPRAFIGYEVWGNLILDKEDQIPSSFHGKFLSPANSYEWIDRPLWSNLQKQGLWRGEENILTQPMTVAECESWVIEERHTDKEFADTNHELGDDLQDMKKTFLTSATDRASLFSSLPDVEEILNLGERERRLIHLLQGRDLLLDEVLKHLSDTFTVMNALQKLYLGGFFDWTSPFVSEREHEHGGDDPQSQRAKSKSVAACLRCGYGSNLTPQEQETSGIHRGNLPKWVKLWRAFWFRPTLVQTRCARCGRDDCYYCPQCLQMGMAKSCEPYLRWNQNRIDTNSQLAEQTTYDRHGNRHATSQYAGMEHHQAEYDGEKNENDEAGLGLLLDWQGTLSPTQQRASDRLLSFMGSTGEEFLLWAVCGAGKTEILYQSLQKALGQRQKVLLTSPRRDVIVELGTRLKEVFPTVHIIVLHADSPEKFEKGDLIVSTTHQTMRFSNYFDLVVIDEEDAFPYHHDPLLPFAVHKAKKQHGKIIYVTATPTTAMQQRANSGKLQHVRLAQRYHGHPLAVPKWQCIGDWRKAMETGEILTPLVEYLLHLQQEQRYGYLFVPRVRELKKVHTYLQEQVMPYLREHYRGFGYDPGAHKAPQPETGQCVSEREEGNASHDNRSLQQGKALDPRPSQSSEPPVRSAALFSNFVIESVHAAHADRERIVQRFREQDIRLLITTTILERGVTIPYSDVAVLGSDDDIFDTAALIQIAGRVGRKFDDPIGHVWFWAQMRTRSQVQAIRHIQVWNEEAGKK